MTLSVLQVAVHILRKHKILSIQPKIRGVSGWGQFQTRRNRYWPIENLYINKQYEPIRQAIYDYHRLVLDTFEQDPNAAREKTLEILQIYSKRESRFTQFHFCYFIFDAKNDELISMFKEGDMGLRRNVYNELLKLDPSRRSKYQQIVRN